MADESGAAAKAENSGDASPITESVPMPVAKKRRRETPWISAGVSSDGCRGFMPLSFVTQRGEIPRRKGQRKWKKFYAMLVLLGFDQTIRLLNARIGKADWSRTGFQPVSKVWVEPLADECVKQRASFWMNHAPRVRLEARPTSR